MSYLPPNPYASLPPAFPPQGGLGGQQPGGFPPASPFGAPAGLQGGGFPGAQPDPMAALQGLQGGGAAGGFPGAQADPMAALQGLQGGGFPGAAGMGQDTFAPQGGGAPQGAQPPAAQGQPQAGVFQHQSGGFADKNTSLSSGGFWTSWKGISAITGGVAATAWLLSGAIRGKWNPFSGAFWQFGKEKAATAVEALSNTFKGTAGLSALLKEGKEKLKTDLPKFSEPAEKLATDLKKFAAEDQHETLSNFHTEFKKLAEDVNGEADITAQRDKVRGLFGKIKSEVIPKSENLKDKVTEAYTGIFDSLKSDAANLAEKTGEEKTNGIANFKTLFKEHQEDFTQLSGDQAPTALADVENAFSKYFDEIQKEKPNEETVKTLKEKMNSAFDTAKEANYIKPAPAESTPTTETKTTTTKTTPAPKTKTTKQAEGDKQPETSEGRVSRAKNWAKSWFVKA